MTNLYVIKVNQRSGRTVYVRRDGKQRNLDKYFSKQEFGYTDNIDQAYKFTDMKYVDRFLKYRRNRKSSYIYHGEVFIITYGLTNEVKYKTAIEREVDLSEEEHQKKVRDKRRRMLEWD